MSARQNPSPCALDATSELIAQAPPEEEPGAQTRPEVLPNQIHKVGLVSHDYNVPDCDGLYDYSEHFARINRLCDEHGCDTILYALFTWDRYSTVPRPERTLFDQLNTVERIILELAQPAKGLSHHVEVWQRGNQSPLIARQRFAQSIAPAADKQAFLDDLPKRQFQNALLMLCGETNIASLIRGSDEFNDPYCFAERLDSLNVRLILNPGHDYMRRYEMRVKRRYYSRRGRTVISVWNQGKGRESYFPWTVFHDDVDRTLDITELSTPFDDRPDIRIGVLNLLQLASEPGRGE